MCVCHIFCCDFELCFESFKLFALFFKVLSLICTVTHGFEVKGHIQTLLRKVAHRTLTHLLCLVVEDD